MSRSGVIAAVLTPLLSFAWSGVAVAQSENTFSVGIDGRLSNPTAQGLDGAPRLMPLVRVRTSPGWHPDLRLDWFTTEKPGVGDQTVRLRIRPVLLGVARSFRHERATFTFSVGAGYAFNGIGGARAASPIRYELDNAWAAGPAAGVWLDVSPRIGLRLSAGYLVVRPRLTTYGPLGTETQTLKADALVLKVGVVYGIF